MTFTRGVRDKACTRFTWCHTVPDKLNAVFVHVTPVNVRHPAPHSYTGGYDWKCISLFAGVLWKNSLFTVVCISRIEKCRDQKKTQKMFWSEIKLRYSTSLRQMTTNSRRTKFQKKNLVHYNIHIDATS